nr:hypothetical protein [uncultured Flavobacterium sp.]
MKKYACLLLFAMLLNGCDDGDLTEEKIDFTEITPVGCDTKTYDLLYKIKSQESLLLKLPQYTLAPEIGTPVVGTKEFDIVADGAYQLVYRAYDGVISKSNICDDIRPTFPNVTNEWFATGGRLKIVTTATTTENTENGSSSITGFAHLIIIEKVTYSKPQGSQVENEDLVFGTITTGYTSPSVTFVNAVDECPTTKQLYNYTSTYSMTINDIDPNLIVEAETPVGSPRSSSITATQNKVVYNTYNGAIDVNYFCNGTPTSPTINTTWNAAVGGIIEVATTKSGTTFTHTITLKNVQLVNGNLSFKLGNSYLLGILTK